MFNVDANPPRSIGEAIGYAVMAFAELEMYLCYNATVLMTRTFDCSHEAAIIGRLLSYSSKVDFLAAMIELRAGDAPMPEGTRDLIDRLREAGTLRNNLVHDEWLGRPSELGAQRVRHRRGRKPYSGDDWYGIVKLDEVNAAVTEFVRVQSALTRYLRALPREWISQPNTGA